MIIDSVVDFVEGSKAADLLGRALELAASPLRRAPRARSLGSGSPLGHPLHPILVTAPIGVWTAAVLLDLTRADPRSARTLVGAGVLMAVPSTLSGASDWLDTAGSERRVGSLHATLNLLATGTYAASWLVRPRRPLAGKLLGLAGAGLASGAGWLGGHLTYGLGVGVDTNAFHTGPAEWTALGVVPRPGVALLAAPGGERLAVTELDGRACVVADRCSHRGGPLSEGPIRDGCFTCPWHDSRFDALTGAVRRGPASIRQPVYEVRGAPGALEVRRREARALRTNPV